LLFVTPIPPILVRWAVAGAVRDGSTF